jgi:hypothetical protein
MAISDTARNTVAGENRRASKCDKNAFASPVPAHVPSSRWEPSLRFTATVIASPHGPRPSSG